MQLKPCIVSQACAGTDNVLTHLKQMQLKPCIVCQACDGTENVLTHLKQMQLKPCIILPSFCWDRKRVNALETNATQALHSSPKLLLGQKTC